LERFSNAYQTVGCATHATCSDYALGKKPIDHVFYRGSLTKWGKSMALPDSISCKWNQPYVLSDHAALIATGPKIDRAAAGNHSAAAASSAEVSSDSSSSCCCFPSIKASSSTPNSPEIPLSIGQVIKFVAIDANKCVDISTGANSRAEHASWATTLYLQRLDGPSKGSVMLGHQVKIVSELPPQSSRSVGRKCLDISAGAGCEADANCKSLGTQFTIRPVKRAEIRYEQPLGIFTTDGKRIDVGSCQADASHNSWATKFEIQLPANAQKTTRSDVGDAHTILC